MFDLFPCSYTPSVVWRKCELSKSQFSLPPAAEGQKLSSIYVYLTLQLSQHNMERTATSGGDKPQDLSICVNLNGELELSEWEWFELFVKRGDILRDFFINPPLQLKMPMEITCIGNLSVYNLPPPPPAGAGAPELLITTRVTHPQKSILLSRDDWRNIEKLMWCINAQVHRLHKVKATYENRINLFKRHLKQRQPLGLEETSAILDQVCDKTSIIDCEIICFCLEFLFNTYYIS